MLRGGEERVLFLGQTDAHAQARSRAHDAHHGLVGMSVGAGLERRR